MGDTPLGGHALVPMGSVPSQGVGTLRPNAAYLAQLLAIKFDCPQTRRRRQAEPGDAAAAYKGQASFDVRTGPHRLMREL